MKAADQSVNDLVRVCAHSASSEDWEIFLRRCTPVVSAVAAHMSRRWTGTAAPSQVLDIVQDVFLRLCERERRILREFVPQGEDSFFALLRVVAASVANDHFRSQNSARRGGKHITTELDESTAGPSQTNAATNGLVHQKVLLSEIETRLRDASGTISPRDRAIFWLYYRHGFTAVEIAALPAVRLSPKGVESALRRVTAWLVQIIEPRRAAPTVAPVKEPV